MGPATVGILSILIRTLPVLPWIHLIPDAIATFPIRIFPIPDRIAPVPIGIVLILIRITLIPVGIIPTQPAIGMNIIGINPVTIIIEPITHPTILNLILFVLFPFGKVFEERCIDDVQK